MVGKETGRANAQGQIKYLDPKASTKPAIARSLVCTASVHQCGTEWSQSVMTWDGLSPSVWHRMASVHYDMGWPQSIITWPGKSLLLLCPLLSCVPPSRWGRACKPSIVSTNDQVQVLCI
eukprot:1157694-Pelagomonas_calceolata.AAC.3